MSELVKVALIGVVTAIVTGGFAVLGQKVIADRSRVELFAKLDKQSELSDARLDSKIEKYQAVTDSKIEELTREVRKHNNFAERIPVIEEKIAVANHRIEDLERKVG